MSSLTVTGNSIRRSYDRDSQSWVWHIENVVELRTNADGVTEEQIENNTWTELEVDSAINLLEWSGNQGYRFSSDWYTRSNHRRQEHLASLGLNLENKRVLEVGAGVGDHTAFFLDRGCEVVVTDGREENLAVVRARHPELKAMRLDMDTPAGALTDQRFDVAYCYGLLYHLQRPAEAIRFLSEHCKTLILETAVSLKSGLVIEPAKDMNTCIESMHGRGGCRPSRQWIMRELQAAFPYAYATVTQPWHKDFPLDWETATPGDFYLPRAVFVASHNSIKSPVLRDTLSNQQRRH